MNEKVMGRESQKNHKHTRTECTSTQNKLLLKVQFTYIHNELFILHSFSFSHFVADFVCVSSILPTPVIVLWLE